MKTLEPLEKIGKFGLHLIDYPSGRWGFVGTVPMELNNLVFETREKALEYYYYKRS